MTSLLEDKSSCAICQRIVDNLIKLSVGKTESILSERIVGIEKVMVEREKAAINAAQTLITKDGQEQLNKFVLKEELNQRIKEIDDKIAGPLGIELRMRVVEQESHGAAEREKRIAALELSRGTIDAKMYMIVLGLSAFIAALATAIMHFVFKG
jgi:hypothetical protein